MVFESWDELIRAFRSLGGEFDNLVLRNENGRRGLYPVDPAVESRIHVPPSLLIRGDDVRLEEGSLKVAKEASVDPAAAKFFEAYHAFTSWSDGGRESVEKCFADLQLLPQVTKDLLANTFGLLPWFEPATDETVLRQFLRARRISFGTDSCVAPVLELSNHDPVGPRMTSNQVGLTLSGVFRNEFAWRYRTADALQMYRSYQFASAERFAFSLPFDVFDKRLGKNIHISIDTSLVRKPQTGVPLPVISHTADAIDISFVLLGDRADPRNGYLTFKNTIVQELGVNGLEFFEGLIFYNRQKIIQLLASVEEDDSPASPTIRKVCRYQLEGLSMVSFQ